METVATSLIIFILIIFVLLIGIASETIFSGDHKQKINQYFFTRNLRIVSIEHTPFAQGWAFEKNEVLYTVFYWNREGDYCKAIVKTSLWTDVYFSNEEVITYAKRNDPSKERVLEQENEKLKKEIELLKHQKS
jgi:hypothetical protein